LLLLVPLRIEQLALGRPDGSDVLRTGMGPARARIAAARAQARDERAVAVAGLCAGVDPSLEAGDVVCATELLDEAGATILVPGSALLAAALRRRGLRVRTGPILSTERVLGPDERAGAIGMLAVDMESAWLAPGAAGRPFAVCRVVVDAAGRRLADPRMLAAGPRALRSLRRAGGALAEWAAIESRAHPVAPGVAGTTRLTA
jgi:4-hydroxy-3-methylbut-2-en-1-yl diphosphate reductase